MGNHFSIILLPTSKCNVNCEYCFEDKTDDRMTLDQLSTVMTKVFDYMEDFLGRHAYFGGAEFTTADIMMHFAIRVAKVLVWIHSEDYPHISAWRSKVESRPAFDRATRAATPGGADAFGLPADVDDPLAAYGPPPRV